MRPRRPSSARHDDAFVYTLQRHRLELIASGEAEPLTERERLFLRQVKARRRPAYADYIVPGPLLRAETGALRRAREAREASARSTDAPEPEDLSPAF
ncbi:MAG: hypothetical protein KJ728_07715 [Alphaproteobacteria bacterium]|jgi:hypothetical protein|uniref:Uncharacterized protein n=1 Tax=Brevundimonas mediterranea TaxID=74329 RepID=A0A6G7ELA3_9CAUL|nr:MULTISPECIES: hypothetical protein [Brevundimonas]MBU1273538.1 hypothetical protein [Alphaproteobacteria bacterium]MDZ4318856.1 hypothetical protein [Phenylobacterium sp.]OGN47492.1 MAG: hypothetical protein A3E24_08725 [Caulobacterales bacterium RIFCSPHIGHO2_12_FULL_68_13]OGN50101.1 MAG: hypothetical protein A2795_06415 [Caulobacterales bacterium RIFCSPHIGHO2_01_FULL_67_30]OYX81682.1 MAG: hypothetical protein B7Y85_00825 [Brevundimonas sp. 32-68-21]